MTLVFRAAGRTWAVGRCFTAEAELGPYISRHVTHTFWRFNIRRWGIACLRMHIPITK